MWEHSSRRPLALAALAGVVALALVVVVLGRQYALFDDELAVAERRIERVDRELEKARAARRHPLRLADEIDRYERGLLKLRALMPPAQSLDGAREELEHQLEPLATEAGCTLTVGAPVTLDRDFFYVAEMAVTVSGASDAMEEFLASRNRVTRLMNWTETERAGDHCAAEVHLFILKLDKPRSPRARREERRSEVWFRPFRRKLQRLGDELDAKLGELEPMRDDLLKVERLERLREELVKLSAIVSQLLTQKGDWFPARNPLTPPRDEP